MSVFLLSKIDGFHILVVRGSSALSPDERTVIVCNLESGMDLYPVGRSTCIRRFQDILDPDRNFLVDVTFLNRGAYVTAGAHRGNMNIWNCHSGEHWQTLSHGGRCIER
jgi:hypothetical protein